MDPLSSGGMVSFIIFHAYNLKAMKMVNSAITTTDTPLIAPLISHDPKTDVIDSRTRSDSISFSRALADW